MRRYKVVAGLLGMFCLLALSVRIAHSQEKAAPATVQVHLVITDQALSDNSELPTLRPENVQVKLRGQEDLEHAVAPVPIAQPEAQADDAEGAGFSARTGLVVCLER